MSINEKKDKTEPTDGLTPKERYDAKKLAKIQSKEAQHTKKEVAKKGKGLLVTGIIILLIVGSIFWVGNKISSIPYLPTTSTQNHSETSPISNIVSTPISNSEQAHMLEHANGDGAPGIIIQYNCDDYKCEPDLIEKLTKVADEYPEKVYLAPNKYDGKIILTKSGSLDVLDSFDEERIRGFIEN